MYQTLRNGNDLERRMSQKTPQMKVKEVTVKNIQRPCELMEGSAAGSVRNGLTSTVLGGLRRP
jgi:hypothetical protein